MESTKNPTMEEMNLFSEPGTGKVEKTITPHNPGRVKYKATYWPAEVCSDFQVTLEPEDPVTVVGRRGITLIVVPVGYIFPDDSQESSQNLARGIVSRLFSWTQRLA